MCGTFTIKSLNTGVTRCVWRLLELREAEELLADVVCVQEPQCSNAKEKAIKQKFSKFGFYAFAKQGEARQGYWQEERHLGRVVTAVSKTLAQRFVHRGTGAAQMVMVDTGVEESAERNSENTGDKRHFSDVDWELRQAVKGKVKIQLACEEVTGAKVRSTQREELGCARMVDNKLPRRCKLRWAVGRLHSLKGSVRKCG